MKRPILYTIICAAAGLCTSCDEGDIVDRTVTDGTDTYVMEFQGQVSGIDNWAEGYDIVIAAFDDEGEYSIIQKQLAKDDADRSTSIVVGGVPKTARTIELCATNKLRRRIVSFATLAVDPLAAAGDTLRLTLTAPLDLGMFATIQRCVFDGTAYNCSLCHGAENGRASLDLSTGHSYANLVNTPSSRIDGAQRVVPRNSAESALHLTLAEGNPAALRFDHSNLLDEWMRRLIDDWIDHGAKE